MTNVASGWDLLDTFDGATPTTCSYPQAKAAWQAGHPHVLVVVSVGFRATTTVVPVDPVVSYGNVTGVAKITATPWVGVGGDSVYWLTAVVSLDTYDGVSDLVKIDLSGGDAANMAVIVNSPNLGAFALTVYNYDASLNPDLFSTIQVYADSADTHAAAGALTFATQVSDLVLGAAFLNVTGGQLDSLSPSDATVSVQQILLSGAGEHGEGAMKANWSQSLAGGDVDLSFGASGANYIPPFGNGPGFRVFFGGFIIAGNRSLVPSTRPKWVEFGRAIRLPHVLGGDGKFENEQDAWDAFITEAQTNQVWAKFIHGASHGNLNIRVDIAHPSVSTQPCDATTFTDTVR